jgi:hypothetical protein
VNGSQAKLQDFIKTRDINQRVRLFHENWYIVNLEQWAMISGAVESLNMLVASHVAFVVKQKRRDR